MKGIEIKLTKRNYSVGMSGLQLFSKQGHLRANSDIMKRASVTWPVLSEDGLVVFDRSDTLPGG